MKIILATPVYPPEIGGPGTYIKELAIRLRVAHDIVIVAYASTSEKISGTTLVTINKRQFLLLRLLKYTVKLFSAARGADVLYVQNGVASGLPALIVGKLRRIPIVLKFVGDEAWERATQLRLTHKPLEQFLAVPEGGLRIRLIMMLQGFVLRHVDAVTTPSQYLGNAIVRAYRIPQNRFHVNYNAADETEVLPFKTSVVPHQIVVTARLVEWKGIAGVIRAVALLAHDSPDVKLLVAGDGPEEAGLKKLVKDLCIERHITFLGRVSRAETWHIRKQSQVYVLNSFYEGLPHAVLTSFAARIPTVATDIPGTSEAVYHEQTGLLVPPGDDAALAQAIGRLFRDASLRDRLVQGAQKILVEKFSWESHLRTLFELFHSVGAHPRD